VLEFAVLFEKPGLKMLVSQELKQLGRPLPAHRSLEDLEPLRVQFLFGNSFKKLFRAVMIVFLQYFCNRPPSQLSNSRGKVGLTLLRWG